MSLTFDVKELGLERVAERIGALLREDTGLLEDIGEGLLLSTEERFDEEVDPEGKPWQELSERYKRRKKNDKILTESTHLRGRIVKRVRRHRLVWGTNVKYARAHQTGERITIPAHTRIGYAKKGRPRSHRERLKWARYSSHRETVIQMPKRAFLGISADDRVMILGTVQDHIERHLQ